jgi:iron complex outermembrane receptor protein
VAQLPADSDAAKLLGVPNLKPEISTSFSAGIVAHPINDLSVTLDAYSISLGDRISGSSTVYLFGGSPIAPVCGDAFTALGLHPDPTAARVGCSVFVNAFGTLTQGVDLTVNYPTDFGDMGLIDWTFAGNYNNTKISRIAAAPSQLAGATFLTPSTAYSYEHPAPAIKAGLTANWSLDDWGVTFRETMYSSAKSVTSTAGGSIPCGTPVRAGVVLQAIDANGCWINNSEPSVGITDLEARYNITEQLQLAIGGNNLFNIRAKANCNFSTNSSGGTTVCNNGGVVNDAPVTTPFDPYGGYYYGRVTIKW